MQKITRPENTSPPANPLDGHDVVFDSTEDFFKGEGREVNKSHKGSSSWKNIQFMSQEFGHNTYELEVRHWDDGETRGYSEEWKKNGAYHRAGDFPAKIYHLDHMIPDEAYLDESIAEFYLDGKLTNTVDKTYENIMQHKPLSVRQAFGVDLEEDIEANNVFSGAAEKLLSSSNNKTKAQALKPQEQKQQKEDLGR